MPKLRPAPLKTQESYDRTTTSPVNLPPISELVERRSQDIRIPQQQLAELEFKDEQGRVVTEKVEISDISRRGLAIRLPHELILDQLVWIRFNSTTSKCMVRHCRKTEDGFTAGIFIVRKEHRPSDREPISRSAVLHWIGGPSGYHETMVSVRNISSDGIQMIAR